MLDERPIEKLIEVVADAARVEGFEPLGAPGLRHGAWERAYIQRATTVGSLNRYLSVSVILPYEGSHECKVFVSGGADMTNRYKRLKFEPMLASAEDIANGVLDATLQRRFKEVSQEVKKILPGDLDKTYHRQPARNMAAANEE